MLLEKIKEQLKNSAKGDKTYPLGELFYSIKITEQILKLCRPQSLICYQDENDLIFIVKNARFTLYAQQENTVKTQNEDKKNKKDLLERLKLKKAHEKEQKRLEILEKCQKTIIKIEKQFKK